MKHFQHMHVFVIAAAVLHAAVASFLRIHPVQQTDIILY